MDAEDEFVSQKLDFGPTETVRTTRDDVAQIVPISEKDDANFMSIVVKSVESANGNVLIKFGAKTSNSQYNTANLSAQRFFSDFIRLQEELVVAHPDTIVPALALGAGSSFSVESVEVWRADLQRFLERVAKHPTLLHDPFFHAFIQGDELPPPKKKAMSQVVVDLFQLGTQSVPDEDMFFDEAKTAWARHEHINREALRIAEKLGKAGKEFSSSFRDFAAQLQKVADAEVNQELSAHLTKFAALNENKSTTLLEKSRGQFDVTSGLFSLAVHTSANIKSALTRRSECAVEYDTACRLTKRRRDALDKLRSAKSPPEKLAKAESDLTEAEKAESDIKVTFVDISNGLKEAFNRIEQENFADTRDALLTLATQQLNTELLILDRLNIFLVESKAMWNTETN